MANLKENIKGTLRKHFNPSINYNKYSLGELQTFVSLLIIELEKEQQTK